MINAKIFQIKEAMTFASGVDNKSCYSNVKGRMLGSYILVFLAFLPFTSFSQIGLNVRHIFGQSDILEAEKISQDGIHASIEYHFRLKENRLEFRPALGYRFTYNSSAYQGYFNSLDADVNVAVYPFDFGGDCNCPTFSKEGNLVKKGFFIELNPGVSYGVFSRVRSEPDDPEKLPIRSKNIIWKIGGSAGLDIGLSEHFTLTPILSATMLSSSEWEGLLNDGSSARLDDHIYFGTGIRITYSAEEKRRRRN